MAGIEYIGPIHWQPSALSLSKLASFSKADINSTYLKYQHIEGSLLRTLLTGPPRPAVNRLYLHNVFSSTITSKLKLVKPIRKHYESVLSAFDGGIELITIPVGRSCWGLTALHEP